MNVAQYTDGPESLMGKRRERESCIEVKLPFVTTHDVDCSVLSLARLPRAARHGCIKH